MRSRWLFAAGPLILAALVFGYRHFEARQEQQLASERLAEWERETHFVEQKLARPVDLVFGKPVHVSDWLAEWSRQTGIPVVVKDDGPEREQISLDLPQTPAGTALSAVSQLTGLNWNLKGGRIEQSIYPHEHKQIFLYPLPPHLARLPREELLNLLAEWRSCLGDSSDFGLRNMELVQHGLLIIDTTARRRLIGGYLEACERLLERTAGLRGSGALPDDPRWEPIPLCEDSEQVAELMRKLDQPVTLDLVNVPLDQFARRISNETGIPFQVDHADQDVRIVPFGEDRTTVTCQVREMRLRSALQLALEPLHLDILPVAGGRTVLIAPHNTVWDERHRLLFAYPVHDLIDSPSQRGPGALMTSVVIMVSPEDWRDLAGPGDTNEWNDYIFSANPLGKHWQLRDLLRAMRRVRSGQEFPAARVGFDSATSLRMQSALHQPVELSYQGETLANVVVDLRDRHGLPIYLNRTPQTLAVEPDQLVTCNLRAQPLHENLDRLLTTLNLGLWLHPEYLQVVPGNWKNRRLIQVSNIRNLVPLLPPEVTQLSLPTELPGFIDDVLSAATSRDHWRVSTLCPSSGLFLCETTPRDAALVGDLLQFVQNGALASTLDVPGGGTVTNDQLNQPLPFPRLPEPAAAGPPPVVDDSADDVLPSTLIFQSHLYFVGDLVSPRGRSDIHDLAARIEKDILDASVRPVFDRGTLRVEPHLNSFLVIHCHADHLETIAKTLRTLRQEVRP